MKVKSLKEKMKNKPLYLVYSLAILFSSFSTAQIIPEQEELLRIRADIEKKVKDSVIPSLAVAVIKGDSILWQEAIGYADVGNSIKATIHSIYPLGSVSKSITATGIMHLINEGNLKLEDDIRPLIHPIQLKDINENTPEIKLWQLVSMNAGINHGYGVFDSVEELPLEPLKKKEFFEETTVVAFPPGTTYEYSNRAFYLSEVIVENLTEQSFSDFMSQKVFAPLKMNNTIVYPFQHSSNKKIVKEYSNRGLRELESNISYPTGGSGFRSSISDMTNYVMFHLGSTRNDKVISAENLQVMHGFREGPADLFGIGWFNQGDKLYSNGNVNGGNAAVSIDKENELGIICLLNKTSWDGIADQYVGKIREVFVKETSNHFKEWKRIYGTPYRAKYELKGNWYGNVQMPTKKEKWPIEIVFGDKEVSVKIDEEKAVINNPVYNLLGEFEGGLNIKLPFKDKETRCHLKIKRFNNKFVGYMQYDDYTEHRYYALPLFIKVKRE